MKLRYVVFSLFALNITGCSLLDHTFAPNIQKASVQRPAPYVAPAITGKRKVGKPYNIMGTTYYPISSSEGYRRKGVASWYGKDFHNKLTANGETYNMYAMTAAHPTLPIPTYVRVTNIENGLSTIVRVNDRGPFLRGRIIDLSYAAAVKLDMAEKGTSPVLVEALPTDGSMLHVRSRFAEVEKNVTNTPTKRYASISKTRQVPIKYTPQKIHKKVDKNSFTHRISQKKNLQNTVVDETNLSAGEPVRIGRHQYFIQTGAFSNKENAARQQTEISEFFSNVKLMSFTHGDLKLHRVRIGPLASVQEADEILGRTIQEGWTTAKIVVD